jgi:ATP-dependent protease ClpP protease subunit
MANRLKRKCNRNIQADETDENMLKDIIAENLIENIIGNKKQKKHNNEEVYRENNHIYFRTHVTIDTCDKLLQLVREFEEDMKILNSDPYIDNDTFKCPDLIIHLTTYGGDLYAAFMTYDNLKQCKYNIVTIAEGYVASAGTVISLGGDVRKIQRNALMMIHQLRTFIGGKFNEIEEDFRNSKLDMKRLINLYHLELGGNMTKKQIEEALTHDIWWDSQTCINKGLCNEII